MLAGKEAKKNAQMILSNYSLGNEDSKYLYS